MPSNTPLDYVTLFIVIKLEMSLKFQITFTLMQMLHGKPSFLAVTHISSRAGPPVLKCSNFKPGMEWFLRLVGQGWSKTRPV